MIAKCVLLALLVTFASASPVTQDNGLVNYREALDMFLDAWKKMLPCGFAADNIPVLAPLTLDFYDFSYVNGDTNLVGNVSNIRISGLNNFQVLSGSYNQSTLSATFDVMFPALQILGSYEVEGVLSIGGLPLPIRQSVLINKKITDWRFVGEYTFGQSLTNSNGLRIKDFNLQYFVAGVEADNWDQYMDVAANNYLNSFINSFSLLFTEEIQPYVNPMFAKYVLPSINSLLSNLDMTELSNYFAMQAELWNNAACNVKA
ncbi:uncharacterized protein LOC6573898 [Drosophila mojavensis]|uniref:uncharacterized protein LOC6573898 n=1 Tax=Drosophila mojavensis TaxID=7230 RepID=UPI001CD14852|nr:uncharacterized protein LOC6573898 [Drosophila mojavensis]